MRVVHRPPPSKTTEKWISLLNETFDAVVENAVQIMLVLVAMAVGCLELLHRWLIPQDRDL